jgi:formylglycine-generating enzyme required for sulfatase activity
MAVLGLLGGVIIYVVTERGRITIDGDPDAVITIDGEWIPIESYGRPISLRAGAHTLEITWRNGQTETRRIIVSRGTQSSLPLSYDPARIIKSLAMPQLIIKSIGIKLALIPVGEFQMGSPGSDTGVGYDETPQHLVRIARPFYLAVTEVTQRQYRAVTNESPSYFKGEDDLPVEQVSWLDAVAFCNALSAKEGLPPFYSISGQNVEVPDWNGGGYRLPTEAEWEYACRANNPARFSFGNDAALLKEYAWYRDNSESKTHPVGQKPANGFGLRDMHGNVWEWCFDAYETDFYSKSPVEDPVCSLAGPLGRMIRGGGWVSPARDARSAYRYVSAPGFRRYYLGFRLARGHTGPK